ncbi:membrane protein [Mangrovibacter sp. MFB070]|uniref:YfgM family protein n=1 Tax=Mangrovibacter sp. MFB070 TaxID=1224318 RepID=UPI0004D706C1|nr:YfgM family protein [Mangrovibacter sp. MFB070]KEA50196.1 membrane protein [Mangrovibacter sp. MFB070]
MEIYDNENEQVEAVKRFFIENGKALAVGVVLGIGALVGWRYWASHQVDSSRESSMVYQNTVQALKADKPGSLAAAEKFIADNKGTYGALASLDVAEQLVNKKDFANAAAQLKAGLADTSDENLKALIGLRLARIQVELKQADDALATLGSIKGDGWSAMVADIKGDALLSKGDTKSAREAWSKGVGIADASPALRNMMQMKMNNLSS